MSPELANAKRIVEAAGAVALEHFRSNLLVENKRASSSSFDPVTAADREVESLIRQELQQQFPDDAIVGEEFGGDLNDLQGRTWVIDPIDGTRAFITGQLGWGILLGLVEEGRAVAGCMHQPFTGETFAGDTNGARWWRGTLETALGVSRQRDLRAAMVCTTDPDMFSGALAERFARVRASARMHRFGGDCYNYCLLAAGMIDAVVESDLQPYDILPLVPVIEAAGGLVTDMNGETPFKGGTVVAAATPELHAEIVGMLAG